MAAKGTVHSAASAQTLIPITGPGAYQLNRHAPGNMLSTVAHASAQLFTSEFGAWNDAVYTVLL